MYIEILGSVSKQKNNARKCLDKEICFYFLYKWIHDINENEVEWCEHMSDVQKRVAECLDSIIEIHKWKNIVICSHASPILQLLAHIDSWSPDCSPAKVPNNKWISHEDAYILREI